MENKVLEDIKKFFNSIELGNNLYYCVHDVPSYLLNILTNETKLIYVNDRIASEHMVDKSSGSLDEVTLSSWLRSCNSYCVFNFINTNNLKKLAQILFMRLKYMLYSNQPKYSILFIEKRDKCKELTRTVKLSRILELYNGTFVTNRITGKYKNRDIDLTIGNLIVKINKNEKSLHDILTKQNKKYYNPVEAIDEIYEHDAPEPRINEENMNLREDLFRENLLRLHRDILNRTGQHHRIFITETLLRIKNRIMNYNEEFKYNICYLVKLCIAERFNLRGTITRTFHDDNDVLCSMMLQRNGDLTVLDDRRNGTIEINLFELIYTVWINWYRELGIPRAAEHINAADNANENEIVNRNSNLEDNDNLLINFVNTLYEILDRRTGHAMRFRDIVLRIAERIDLNRQIRITEHANSISINDGENRFILRFE